MRRQRYKTSRYVTSQGTMIVLKEHNNVSIINSKQIKIYIIPDKKFKIIILRKLSKLQENSDNLAKRRIHEQNKFKKRNHKKKPNNDYNEKCNIVLNSRFNQVEEEICEFKNRFFEIMKTQGGKRMEE